MAASAPSSVAPSQTGPALLGRRVLVVDDDPVLLRAWTRTLKKEGLTRSAR